MENRRSSITYLSGSRELREIRKSSIKWRINHWLFLLVSSAKQGQQDPRIVHKVGFSIRGNYLNSVKRNRLKRVIRSLLREATQGFNHSVLVLAYVSRRVTKDEWQQHELWLKKNRSRLVKKLYELGLRIRPSHE